jgi:hypothetical protein
LQPNCSNWLWWNAGDRYNWYERNHGNERNLVHRTFFLKAALGAAFFL